MIRLLRPVSPSSRIATSVVHLTGSGNNGAYLEDNRVFQPEEVLSWGRDDIDAEKLWKLSEELVGEKFQY